MIPFRYSMSLQATDIHQQSSPSSTTCVHHPAFVVDRKEIMNAQILYDRGGDFQIDTRS